MSEENAAESQAEQGSLPEIFRGIVESFIDEKGLELAHAVCVCHDGGIEVVALAVEPEQAYKWLLAMAASRPDIVEIMLGIDRYTKEGQGSEFDDVVAGPHWRRQPDGMGTVQGFTIDYKFGPPKIVRPVSYDNDFWREAITQEVNSCVAAIAREVQAAGRAVREEV